MTNAMRLLIEDHWVDSVQGLRRVVNQATLVTFAPFGARAPWEDEGIRPMCGIFFDPDIGRYRMWYRSVIAERTTATDEKGVDPTERVAGKPRNVVCYAESADGVHWERPDLGLVEFQGTRKNNIVTGIDAGDSVFWNVLKDPADPDPARRFKAFGFASAAADSITDAAARFRAMGNHVSFSPDGLHWSPPRLVASAVDVTDCNLLLRQRDPLDGCWRAFVRPRCGPKRRFIGLSRSHDFDTWTLPEMMLAPTARDGYDTEFYGLAAEKVGDLYVGALWIMHNNPDYCPMFNELVVSQDGNRFTRVAPGMFLIAPGAPGAPDERGNWVTTVLARANDLLLYAFTSTGDHGNNRRDPRSDCAHTLHGEAQHGFGIYTLPRDRYAGWHAEVSGELTTPWTTVYGKSELTVIADIAAGGCLRADVLDCYDRVVPGYDMMRSRLEPAPGAPGRAVLRWNGDADMPGETVLPGTGHHNGNVNPGHVLRFRFYLRRATLYGYGAASATEG